MKKIAVFSVFYKTGIVEYARDFDELGWEIISSGGTAKKIAEAGISVTDISELTGYPVMLGHRVATLHPTVHGGILARRIPEDEADLKKHNIPRISHVCVDPYPVGDYAKDPNRTILEMLDLIDIGGPTMIRGAAKNYPHGVSVVCDPADRKRVISELKTYGRVREPLRTELAFKVFAMMTGYNGVIAARMAEEFDFPFIHLVGTNGHNVRYGTNPHQEKAQVFFQDESYNVLREGKPLSYTNWDEITYTVELLSKFDPDITVCAVFKHLSPPGIAIGKNVGHAFYHAWRVDPIASFGSTVAVNGIVTEEDVKVMCQMYFEVLVCKGIEKKALKYIKKTRKNLRVVQTERVSRQFKEDGPEVKKKQGIILVQEPDFYIPVTEDFIQVSKKAATPKQIEELVFATKCCQIQYSNATVITRRGKIIGYGRNGASRVDVCQLAVAHVEYFERGFDQSVAVTDGFFPFPDGLEVLTEAGVKVIACPNAPTPGMRSKEVIAKADELGIAFYHINRRLFRH